MCKLPAAADLMPDSTSAADSHFLEWEIIWRACVQSRKSIELDKLVSAPTLKQASADTQYQYYVNITEYTKWQCISCMKALCLQFLPVQYHLVLQSGLVRYCHERL